MRSTPALHPADEAIIDRFVHHTVAVLGRSEDTGTRHRSNLGRFLVWCRARGSDALLLSVDEVQRFLDDERRRGLSPSAMAAVMGTLRPFYDHLCPGRPNPARAIPLPRHERRWVPPYQPDEAAEILHGLRRSRGIDGRFDLAVVVTLVDTGIHRSELGRLLTSDLDLDAAVLHVRNGSAGARWVPVSAGAAEVLGSYLAEVRPFCPRSDFLFANPRLAFDSAGYGRLDPAAAGRLVRCAGLRGGVDGSHTCYRWRVTATVEMLRAGVPVEEVRRRLGHGEVATTARYRRFLDHSDQGW